MNDTSTIALSNRLIIAPFASTQIAPRGQHLRVISGLVMVWLNNEPFILSVGDDLLLDDDYGFPISIISLGRTQAIVDLSTIG